MAELAKDEKIAHSEQHIISTTVIEPNPTEVKAVKNVALADAIAKQKPSLWTRRMFQVRF